MLKKLGKIMALLLSVALIPMGSFADANGLSQGVNLYYSIPLGETLSMSNVKTYSGSWKTVKVKLLTVVRDEAGFAAIAKAQNFKEAINTIDTEDHYRVKMTVEAMGYTQDRDDYVSNNLPIYKFLGATLSGEAGTVSIVGGFEGSLYQKTTQYINNNKIVNGEWVRKHTNEGMFKKGIALTGNVYITLPKGTLSNAVLRLDTSDHQYYMALSKQVYQPVLPKIPVKTYGDPEKGMFDSDFNLINESSKSDESGAIISKYIIENAQNPDVVEVDTIIQNLGQPDMSDSDCARVERKMSQIGVQLLGSPKEVIKDGWHIVSGVTNASGVEGVFMKLVYKVDRSGHLYYCVAISLPREKDRMDVIITSFMKYSDQSLAALKS